MWEIIYKLHPNEFSDIGFRTIADGTWIEKFFTFFCGNCKIPSNFQGKILEYFYI